MPDIIRAPKQEYSEIYQSVDIKYSFVNKVEDNTYKELFAPVKCRDFLGDALYATEQKKEFRIFGFYFDGTQQTVDTEKTRLLISNISPEFRANLQKNWRILSEVEDYHNLEATRIIDCDQDTLLLEASSAWKRTMYLISLYTYLIRVICYEYKDIANWREELYKWNHNESRYMRDCTIPRFVRFVKEIFNICEDYKGVSGFNKEDNYIIHNYSGFVSVCTSNSNGEYHKKFKEILKQK